MPDAILTPDAYRQLVEQSPVLTWRSDLTRGCDFFNERWLRWTGRTIEQELGLGWAEGVHREDFARCLEIYVGAFDAREPFEMEYRLRRADGEYRWIFERGVPYADDAGAFAGYIGSCIDIHDAVEGRAAKESGAGTGQGVTAEDFARTAQAAVEAGSFSAAPEDASAEEAATTVTTISASAQAAAAEAPAQE